MTEGHGEHGQPEDPGGSGPARPPTQGSPPAPGYPPYPGPPQGGGWPPYPGYGPAPSAPPGYGAPPQLERPTSVRAGLGAFIAGVILGAIGLVYEVAHFSDLVETFRTAAAAQGVAGGTPISPHAYATLTVAGGWVGIGIDAFFIWFAWQGRNWARIVLWVFGGLGVVAGLTGLSNTAALAGFLEGLSICQWVLSLAAIVLLAQKSANEWYRYRKWRRAYGQRR